MADALKISVLRKSQPVDLEVEEGMVTRYYVKEMTGAQRDEYFNKTAQRTKTDANGEVIGLRDYKGMYSTLLSFCIYDAEQKAIPETKIQEWPDTAQKALFEVARGLNGMSSSDSEGNSKN
jgi:hypothetical protein